MGGLQFVEPIAKKRLAFANAEDLAWREAQQQGLVHKRGTEEAAVALSNDTRQYSSSRLLSA